MRCEQGVDVVCAGCGWGKLHLQPLGALLSLGAQLRHSVLVVPDRSLVLVAPLNRLLQQSVGAKHLGGGRAELGRGGWEG